MTSYFVIVFLYIKTRILKSLKMKKKSNSLNILQLNLDHAENKQQTIKNIYLSSDLKAKNGKRKSIYYNFSVTIRFSI